jgi:hypothetical protein
VRRTDSAEGSRVGIPDKTDSTDERDTNASDIDAISEGELPESVGELAESVVACGMGSASARHARQRSRIPLKNISKSRLLMLLSDLDCIEMNAAAD